jgi:hypothetical protein
MSIIQDLLFLINVSNMCLTMTLPVHLEVQRQWAYDKASLFYSIQDEKILHIRLQ